MAVQLIDTGRRDPAGNIIYQDIGETGAIVHAKNVDEAMAKLQPTLEPTPTYAPPITTPTVEPTITKPEVIEKPLPIAEPTEQITPTPTIEPVVTEEIKTYPKGTFGASPAFTRKLGLISSEEESSATEGGEFFVITPDVVKGVKDAEKVSEYPKGTFVADPKFAEKAGFVTSEEAEQAIKAGKSFIITPEDVEVLRQRAILEQRKEELQKLRIEDPQKYYAAYVTSTWAKGPISAAGIGVRTIVDPIISGKEEAREKELTRFAERTLEFEESPIEYTVKGMAQVPLIYTASYGLGVLGTKAALAGPVKGAIFSYGTKAIGLTLTTKYVGEPVFEVKLSEKKIPYPSVKEDAEWTETFGRLAEIGAALPFTYYGYKAGVTYELERVEPARLIKAAKLPPKQAEKFLKQLELAKKLEKIPVQKTKSVKGVIDTMPRMKGKVGDVTYKHITETKGTVGGSVSQSTQTKGGRIPKDIDVFTKDPKGYIRALYLKYQAAGIKSHMTVGKDSASISIDGKKVIEAHPESWLADKMFFRGTVKSEEGIEILSIRGQVFRKAIGPIEEPEKVGRLKDIPDFQQIVKSIIRTGQIKAETGSPFLKGYRKSIIEEAKGLFVDTKKKGLASIIYGVPDDVPKTSLIFIPPQVYVSKYEKVSDVYPVAAVYKKETPISKYKPVVPYTAKPLTPYAPPAKEPTYTPPTPITTYTPTTPPPTYTPPSPPPTYAPTTPPPTYTPTTPPPTYAPPTPPPTRVIVGLNIPIIEKEKEVKFEIPKIKKDKKKVPFRFSYPDLISTAISQAKYGKATVPKFTPIQEYKIMKMGAVRVPTKEMMLAGVKV